jgi:hypothetical protein
MANKEIVKIELGDKPERKARKLLPREKEETTKEEIKKELCNETEETPRISVETPKTLADLKNELKEKENQLNLRIKEEQEETERLRKELKEKAKEEKKARRAEKFPFKLLRKKKRQEEIEEETYSEPDELKLFKADEIMFKFCPQCSAKLERQNVEQVGQETFRQILKCRKCPFKKEIIIKL